MAASRGETPGDGDVRMADDGGLGRYRFGKWAHHCVVIDELGGCCCRRRVVNDEAALLELIAAVLAWPTVIEVVWATDLNAGGAALLIALLADRGQQVLYIPGPDRAPRRGDLPRRRQDRRQGRPDHRRPGPDAHRSAAGPRRRSDQHRSAAADLPAHRHDLRPGPRDQPAASHDAGVLPCAGSGFRLLQEGAADPAVRLSDPGGIRRIGVAQAWRLAEKPRLPRQRTRSPAKAVGRRHAQHTMLPAKPSARSSSPSSPSRSPPSTPTSPRSTSRSSERSTSTATRRSCSACPASGSSWPRRSSPTPAAT